MKVDVEINRGEKLPFRLNSSILSVEMRQHPEQAATNPHMDPLSDNYRSQWRCKHCGAWNTGENLLEPAAA